MGKFKILITFVFSSSVVRGFKNILSHVKTLCVIITKGTQNYKWFCISWSMTYWFIYTCNQTLDCRDQVNRTCHNYKNVQLLEYKKLSMFARKWLNTWNINTLINHLTKRYNKNAYISQKSSGHSLYSSKRWYIDLN